tara:strand:+ start:519 stop:764 length:246 start_codon:yes stop_codon:yes gene_type:complete
MSSTKFSRSKQTKRFTYNVTRDTKSHQAGANTVTIQSKDYDTDAGRGYSFQANEVPGTVTMSVKEALALYNFLGKNLDIKA